MSVDATRTHETGRRSTAVDDAVRGAAAADEPLRLGFLGVGWIGRHRMRALAGSGLAEVAAVADPSAECVAEATADAPDAATAAGLDGLLGRDDLDGIVIATPSALHADQAIAALEAGLPVFCQKPLARTAAEAQRVVDAARAADRLVDVDLSYRHTRAAISVREQIAAGATGPIHTADLVFHNAYGPDKPWFLDPTLSGGGCAIDLGVHLIDQLLWTLGFPEVARVESRIWRGGRPAAPDTDAEDFCLAELDLANGVRARLACSWFSHEGRDAVIEATFRGRDGSVSMFNERGSFYDFAAELRTGTSARRLVSPPDDWGGRGAVAWAERLARGRGYDDSVEHVLASAAVIDSIYGR
jgi:predicted dehydrogenase